MVSFSEDHCTECQQSSSLVEGDYESVHHRYIAFGTLLVCSQFTLVSLLKMVVSSNPVFGDGGNVKGHMQDVTHCSKAQNL